MPRLKMRQAVTQPLDKPFRFIPLTQGKVAVVDVADFDRINQWHWSAHRDRDGSWYARVTIPMHRMILGPCGIIDHANRDGLDNRRENLRVATFEQNMRNRKWKKNKWGFKGVHKPSKTWEGYQVRIMVNGVRKSFGYFKTPEAAAHAYDKAAKHFYGEFAHLNFPDQSATETSGAWIDRADSGTRGRPRKQEKDPQFQTFPGE